MSLSGFLTCRPDLVVMGDLCASAVNWMPVGQCQVNVDSWVSHEVLELQNHTAVGAWADHWELR